MELELVNELSLDILQGEKLKRNFYQFTKEFWKTVVPEKPVWNWHIEYLCNELQQVGERIIKRLPKDKDLIVNVPPGTSKSTICSIMFPAWLWANDSTLRIMTISYSADVATGFATKSRYIIESKKYKSCFPNVILTKDVNSKSHYTTITGGERIALSTGGKVTSYHSHLLIADDLQNATDINSETERENANTFIGQSLDSRKTDSEISTTIFIQQRLHSQDTTAYLLGLQGIQYNHICLPAELNDNVKPQELTQHYVNGLLDPVRLSLKVLQAKRVVMGSKAYNTQYNQNPEDNEDAIIKKEWVKVIKKERFDELMKYNAIRKIHFYSDTAYTEDKKNDPSAIIATVKIANDLYVTNAVNVWQELPDFIKTLQAFCFTSGYTNASRIVIEPKASGLSIIQTLKKLSNMNVIKGKPPTQNKIERLNGVSPVIESGRLILVEGQWNKLIIEQLTSNYPVHDDLRDCIVTALEENLIEKKNKGKYYVR